MSDLESKDLERGIRVEGNAFPQGSELRTFIKWLLHNAVISRNSDVDIILRRYFKKSSQKRPEEIFSGFPRFWELFSYILPHGVRKRVFEPAFNEMIEDYLETRGRYRTRWAKRWLTFAFTFRTALMVFDCFRALLTHRAFRFVSHLLPEPIRSWWSLRQD